MALFIHELKKKEIQYLQKSIIIINDKRVQKLLDFIFDRCRELGHKKIQLETGINQPEAINVYEKYGFIRINPFNNYKEDPLSIFFEVNI